MRLSLVAAASPLQWAMLCEARAAFASLAQDGSTHFVAEAEKFRTRSLGERARSTRGKQDE